MTDNYYRSVDRIFGVIIVTLFGFMPLSLLTDAWAPFTFLNFLLAFSVGVASVVGCITFLLLFLGVVLAVVILSLNLLYAAVQWIKGEDDPFWHMR